MPTQTFRAAEGGSHRHVHFSSRTGRRICVLALLASAAPGGAGAQEVLPSIEVGAEGPARPASPQPDGVSDRRKDADESSSAKIFTGAEVVAVPFSRPGEALEIVPGLIVAQHSGEGKANQYFLRGFNLDHGADLALHLDGMPLNMRTHGHAQGYADANFLIPELLSFVVAHKGPYFADEGDFASAGSVHLQYVDKLDKGLFSATGGRFGYGRLLGAKSHEVNGGDLLAALETSVYDGPWARPDELRKINGVMRWSRGADDNGLSITGMAYASRWHSTDQIPERAVSGGMLPLWGDIDGADGGDTTRFSLSARWSEASDGHASRVSAYVVRSTLDLYNNFTYFLGHGDVGDQFRQFDRRTLAGVDAVHSIRHDVADFPIETRIGFQGRYDSIRLGLQETVRRQPYDAIRNDRVDEGGFAFWTDSTAFWTPRLRTTAGVRVDYLHAGVSSLQNPFDAPKVLDGGGNVAAILSGPFNGGSKGAAMVSPKAGAVFGPFYDTEFFVNFGEGFHSTDARGTVQRFDTTALSDAGGPERVAAIPLLVKSRGAEIGARTKIIEGLLASISLWRLDFDSENQFVGDTGTTTFGRPSRRYGIEITNHYAPNSWLRIDGDVALTHARYRGVDQSQTAARLDLLAPDAVGYKTFLGNAPGNHLTNAPNIVASLGVEIGEKTGWFGALKYRYLGVRPLTEDGYFKSPATGTLNLRLGYRFDDGWTLQADAFNVTNSRSDQITYAYGSLLPTDALYGLCAAGAAPSRVCAVGVMDRHFKPVEPPALRVTLGGTF